MKCPACEVEMDLLVVGIFQCPKCKKIVKQKAQKKESDSKEKEEEEALKEGKTFNLNRQYEIPESGIVIKKGKIAVLKCHSAYLKSDRYLRISWWKNSFTQHAGMIKISEKDVLKNIIIALEKIDESFDEFWTWHGKFGNKKEKSAEQLEKEKQYDIIKYRIIENRTCPNCQNRMEKHKFHYECPKCGEMVILEGYNQPIFNRPTDDLELDFQSNFPINFYLPVSGITVKWLMGEWKALAIIYSKDNPNKKWLRFYWWVRDLSSFIKTGYREMGEGAQLGWKAQRGAGSTNIYDKKLIKPLIEALKNMAVEMNWDI